MKNMQLELYTRPTCADCKAAKEFLSENKVHYTEYDLNKQPAKEKELIAATGTRIVPAFVFKKKSLLGFMSKPKVIIGFERNQNEIETLLSIRK